MGKLRFEDAEEIRRRHEGGEPLTPLAREFGVSVAAASHVVHYQTHWPIDTEMVGVFLPPEDMGALRRLAAARGISSSELLSGIIRGCIPRASTADVFGGFSRGLADERDETPTGPPEDLSALWADEGPPRPRRRRGAAGR